MSNGSGLGRRRQLLLGIMLGLLVVLAIEALLQLAYFAQSGSFLFQRVLVPIYEADPVRCFRLRSDLAMTHSTNEFSTSIFTNAQGFRTDASRRAISFAKEPGVTRILVLGPSFAFGWGVDYEQSFATLMGEELRRRGHRVEVINAGVPAQGSAEQLCWLRAEGWRYQPDIVVQVDYSRVGGIAEGCPESLACPVVEAGYVYKQAPTFALHAAAWLKNLGIVFYAFQFQHLFASATPARADGVGKELQAGDVARVDEDDPEILAARFQRYTAFVRSSLGREAPVLFVHIPLAFVVHPEDLPRWRHLGASDATAPRLEAERRIGGLVERGIPIVDTTPALRARAARERTYYWLDIHLTPAGNEAVAEALLPLLEASLPEASRRTAQSPSRARRPASSMTSTSSSRARSSLLPGSAPATT